MKRKTMKTNSSQQETRYLILYFVLAYAISWAIGIPLALEHQGLLAPRIPNWAHYFVAYGPLLSAVIVTGLSEGVLGLKNLWERLTLWKVPSIWWVAAFSPLIIGVVVILGLVLVTGEPISIATLGEVNFLPPLGIGALALLTFGIGEETGWRGYALPRLQKNRSALSATLILAVFWALWHLPQFFYLFDPAIAIGWGIGLFAGAIVFTWLFNSANGSILILAVWHGCFNFMSASDAGNGVLATVVSTLVMIWAVVVIWWFKPQNLSSQPKVVSSPNGGIE
jgi:membrane protease YdiL (CAAX protease family)